MATPGSSELRPCCSCGTLVDPKRAYLSGDGPVCDGCHDKQGVIEEFARAAKYYSSTSLTLAVVSFLINPLFVFTIAAIVVGVRGILKFTRGDLAKDFAEALGRRHKLHIVGCLAGIGFALFAFFLRLVVPVLLAVLG